MFTNAARLRMLKMMATVDFDQVNKSLFVTLTYPTELEMANFVMRRQHRYLFLRSMEAYLGRQFPALWRVEWQVRKSGPTKGKLAPHFHLLLFGTGFISWQFIREEWKRIIGATGHVATDVRRITGAKRAGFYVAKYAAKPSVLSLVNDAQLNTPDGRHWGYHRGRLIPRRPLETLQNPTKEVTDFLYYIARQIKIYHDLKDGESFTLLGDQVKHVRDFLARFGLAAEAEA